MVPYFSHHVRLQRKNGCWGTRKEALTRYSTWPAQTLTSASARDWKTHLSISHSVCAVLIQQPELRPWTSWICGSVSDITWERSVTHYCCKHLDILYLFFVCLFVFVFLLFAFPFWKFLLTSSSSEILFSAMPSLLMSPSKAFFISITALSLAFLFNSENLHLPAYIAQMSCAVYFIH